MSFVTQDHRNTIEAYDLLATIESEDIDGLIIEVAEDPGDEEVEGFTALCKVYSDDEDNMYFQGCWNETPLGAAEGLKAILKEEGFIND